MTCKSARFAAISIFFLAFASACQAAPAAGSASLLSAGGNSSCAVNSKGAYCWGENNAGQLGDGTAENRSAPVPVTSVGGRIASLSIGYTFLCVISDSAGVVCLGSSAIDQSQSGRWEGFKSIAVGTSHVCGLTASGGVKCWGGNMLGALGDGTTENRPAPADVSGMASGVAAVAAGVDFTCAVQTGGVKCWGSNDIGQLGDGTYTGSLIPVAVSGLDSGVAGVAVGVFHACAWKTNGEAWCWGENTFGQLGDGTQINNPIPVNVTGISGGVKAIAVGGNHTCAVTVAGGVVCWGNNDFGQLGDGTTGAHNLPVAVPGLSGVAAIAAGSNHTCALLKSGAVYCWGLNGKGQLGNGNTTDSSKPVDVVFPAG